MNPLFCKEKTKAVIVSLFIVSDMQRTVLSTVMLQYILLGA